MQRHRHEQDESGSVAISEPDSTGMLTKEEHYPTGNVTLQYSKTFRHQDNIRLVSTVIYACWAGVMKDELVECIRKQYQEKLGAEFHMIISEGDVGQVVGHSKGFALGLAIGYYKNHSFLMWEDSA
ncbi:GIP [Symbiodinium sp. CCMP2456]|nr:GIP [Symbiodinium sp. CCMP2456]